MSGLSAAQARTHLLRTLELLPPGIEAAPRPIVLAVSGGPDSLSLLLLAAENRCDLRAAGFTLAVATVDHGLRAASIEEAAFVAGIAAQRGLPHRTLAWNGAKPAGGLSARARAARYRLLAEHARAIGAVAVLTAHHEDDQIETHHLAALRKAGDRGLAGMRAARALEPGIHLLRPFLPVPGAALKASVAERGIAGVNDPTNFDPRYERARIRLALSERRDDRRETLARIASHAARRDAEDAALGAAFGALCRSGALCVDDGGSVCLDNRAFRAMDERLGDAALVRILRAVGGAEHAPPHDAVRRLAGGLREKRLAGATLGGVAVRAGETTAFIREYGRNGIESRLAGTGAVLFDRRMRVKAPREDVEAGMLVAFGCLGRGNAREKTLPVLVDGQGRVVAAHARLLRKLAETVRPLDVSEEVSFRLFADLADGAAN